MSHTLPLLDYPLGALAPTLSQESLEFHYGKHHQAYVDKLNLLLEKTEDTYLNSLSLEELLEKTPQGPMFNNAAQSWNHSFYWKCLTPEREKNVCSSEMENLIAQNFNSFENFKMRFMGSAIDQFGSGWAWLVKNKEGTLSIETTGNAGTPKQRGATCLLTCDVWEHAYYIDYRNKRQDYLTAFWDIVNWKFVEENLKK